MLRRGLGRQAIAQHDGEIDCAAGSALQPGGAFGVEPAAPVGAAQIGLAVGRPAGHGQAGPAHCGEAGGQRCGVERQLHRITRLGVGRRKTQQLSRGQAGAGAAQGDAGGGVAAQLSPGIGGGHDVGAASKSSIDACSAVLAPAGSSSPPAPVMPLRCNQASNSGARLSPSSLRTNSASWKEVLW